MPTKIFLEALTDVHSNGSTVTVTLETYIALYVYQHLGAAAKELTIILVQSERPVDDTSITVNVTEQPHLYQTAEQYSTEMANLCNFPVLVTDQMVVVAGLCGVCRGMIKCTQNENLLRLLGFKGACLLAPSEMSIWTKFCEIDIIVSTKTILAMCSVDTINGLDCVLPESFGRFESHMGQPLRMHNVYKFARNVAKKNLHKESANEKEEEAAENAAILLDALSLETENATSHVRVKIPRLKKSKKKKTVHISSTVPIKDLNLDHTFVEGQDITLADIIIYACFLVIVEALPTSEQLLQNHLPLTAKWLRSIGPAMAVSKLGMQLSSAIRSNKLRNMSYKVDVPVNYSLYKNDSKRYKPQSQIFTKQHDIDVALAKVNQMNLQITSNSTPNIKQFDWNDVPYAALPEGGNLPADRLERKKHQLQSLALEVLAMAKPGHRIVDFCSGAGHLGIVVAYKLPACQIILLENKEESMMRAKRRVDQLRLTNVLFFQCNLDYFHGHFDIGTSLHACGVATDIVLSHCLRQQAHFVCCPCCYGGIHEMPHIRYPRSELLRSIGGLSSQECMHIAHCADQAHDIRKGKCNIEKSVQGQYCMDVIDWDRKLCAEECGYAVRLTRLQPEDCTPKNRLLIGVMLAIA